MDGKPHRRTPAMYSAVYSEADSCLLTTADAPLLPANTPHRSEFRQRARHPDTCRGRTVSTTPLKPQTFARSSMLVACDIDGTLLERGGKIPAETVTALDLVRAAGHEVVLATGRSAGRIAPRCDKARPDRGIRCLLQRGYDCSTGARCDLGLRSSRCPILRSDRTDRPGPWFSARCVRRGRKRSAGAGE